MASLLQAGVVDTEVIVGAILHDTVEDTDTSLEEIEAVFGAAVRGIVAEVTDDKNLAKEERKRLQVVQAPHKSAKVGSIFKPSTQCTHALIDLPCSLCLLLFIPQSVSIIFKFNGKSIKDYQSYLRKHPNPSCRKLIRV